MSPFEGNKCPGHNSGLCFSVLHELFAKENPESMLA